MKQIVHDITQGTGYTEVEMTDGVTEMTSSNLKASTSGDVTGIRYYRSGGSYGTADPENGNYGTEWTDAPHATINDKGEVDWDLGNMILEDGVTYWITFVVWPSQESLDLVADLNNGVRGYDSLTEAERAQIQVSSGHYSLKTNTDYPTLTYSTVTTTTVDGQTHTEVSDPQTTTIKNPDPVGLAEEKLNALKIWEDSLDPSQREEIGTSVTLYLMMDGKYYYKDSAGNPMGVTLQESENWEKSDYIAVAPGLMVTEDSPAYDASAPQVTWGGKTYALIEEGHDYVFKESESNIHFELTAFHHHPMIMGENTDGTPNVVDVIFNDDMTEILDVKKLTDSLSATNTLKGGINIEKKVVDENGEAIDCTDPFTVKVTMTDQDGNALPEKTAADGTKYTIDYRIYYGPNNPKYQQEGVTPTWPDGRSGHIYVSGKSFEETLYVGDVIRVVNVEDDTIYTVEETAPVGYELDGVTYEIAYAGDQTKRKADPDHTVQGNSASYATVTNKYTYGDLEVSKTVAVPADSELTVDTNKESTFTFNLYSDEAMSKELTGLKYDYVKTDASGTETTGTITEGGTFKLKHGEKIHFNKLPEAAFYKITEAKAAGYDTTSTGATGQIAKNETVAAAFTNTYNPTPVTVDPPVQKVIEGTDELYNKGKFTFTIAGTGPEGVTAPLPENTDITDSAAYELKDKKGFYEFGEIEFTVPGEYEYTVTESGQVPGVTNDKEASKKIKFTVTDNNGALVVTPTTDEAVFTFTNVYKAEPTTAQIEVNKTIKGYREEIKDKTFTFELYDADGKKIDEITIDEFDAEGKAKAAFKEIEYDKVGTSNYTIKETLGDAAGFVYDTSEYKAKVVVTDNVEKGQLEAAVSYTKAEEAATEITFENEFSLKSVDVELKLTKTIDDQSGSAKDGTFKFNLYEGAAVEEGAEPVDTKEITTKDLKGEVTFDKLTFTEAGTYDYVVVEEAGDAAGFTYDTTEHAYKIVVDENFDVAVLEVNKDESTLEAEIVNIYKAKETTATLKVKKEVEDTSGSAYETTFNFTATGPNDYKGEASVTGPGTAEFTPEITFDKVGTYEYTIKETAGDAKGYKYDTAEYKVKVNVTDEGGQLVAKVVYVDKNGEDQTDLTITNTYDPEDASVVLTAEKVVEGLPEGATDSPFTFELLEGSKVVDTVVRSGAGTVTFKELTFDKVGTYTYTIREAAGDAKGYTYDSAEYQVTIEVTDDKEGNLKATVSGGEGIVFTNTYEAEPGSVIITANKVLTGRDLKDGEFEFELRDADGEVIATATNDAKGNIVFDKITYDEVGTYEYTIAEVAGDDENIDYDDNEYTITVEVTDEGDGVLSAKASGTATFSNTYNPPVPPTPDPKTGDGSMTGLLMALLALCASGTTLGVALRRRERA